MGGLMNKDVISVLIIEGCNLTRMGLCAALNKDYEISIVGEAEDTLQGLELVKNLKPNIVIMDINLPGMNGLEVTQKVKEISPDTNVVIMTTHDGQEEVLVALSLGANAYCLKDTNFKNLPMVIKNVLKGTIWLDPTIVEMVMDLRSRCESFNAKNAAESSERLTEREFEVLKLLVEGKRNVEIAEKLFISIHTAKAHIGSILHKLHVHHRTEAAVKAIKDRLI